MTEPDPVLHPSSKGDTSTSIQRDGDEQRGSGYQCSGPPGEGLAQRGAVDPPVPAPEGFGWDGMANSVPMVVLGKVGLILVLAGWLVGYVSDPDIVRNTLYLSITPLAVIVGFGLKHLYSTVKAAAAEVRLASKDRPLTLLKILLFVGTIGAVLGVLAYSLVPEFDADGLWGIGAGWPLRPLGGFVLMWVVLAFTLLIRFPILALTGERLVDAMEAWGESPQWETIRKARRKDNRVVALLFVVYVVTMAIRGSPPFADAGLFWVFLVAFAYEAFCALAFRGTTWGKRRTGLRVVSDDGSRASRLRAFARSLVLYLPLLVVGILRLDAFLGMGAAVTLFPLLVLYGLGSLHPYQRGFADLKTGTRVVPKAT